ncbi:MAG TPA: tetratricopeptide repeat-containing sensor histidine kinase, partial [Chryseosolibacter sp.]|nr:tetratricopeptide repeat-containing sensor histidine kinase [Chryseosolibacter sp.]
RFIAIWCFTIVNLCLLPRTVWGRDFEARDSLQILNHDSLAYRLFLSKPDSAIALANEAVAMARQLNYTALEGLGYYVLSKAYWAKANYRFSAEFGFKALKIFENSRHVNLWGKCLLSLARTFIDLQNHRQGSAYIERALQLSKTAHDVPLLAEAYREKSMLLSETQQYDSALSYANRALELFQTFKDSLNISILYGRKAKIYFYKNDYKNSAMYNRISLVFDSLAGNRRALGITYYQAALDALHTNKTDSAIILLKKSIPINKQIRNLNTLIKVHALLGDIYLNQRKPELAVREHKLSSLYKDSLYNTERSGQIQEMQSLYELSSKEETIEQLAQDNFVQQQRVKNQRWFVGFLLLCVLLLGLGIFFLTRFRRLQEHANVELASKNRAIEQQKEEIQSQAETLQQLNNIKSKLFSVISHDLRGPIATLRSLLDLLGKNKVTPDEFITVSDKLRNNLSVTERTLENLLNWSLSQMEGIRTESKVVNINNVITDACDLMKEAAERKNVNILIEAEDPLHVTADSNQLQIILRNLIHNAIKFSRPNAKVYVSAFREIDFCVVAVTDGGIGMSRQELDTILSSKIYFSKAGTLQEKGTGLGLLLCKEFIKLNGGEMFIHSKENEGTQVRFSIPLALEPQAALAVSG